MRGKGCTAIWSGENRICAFQNNHCPAQICGLTRAIHLAARQSAKGSLKFPLMRGQYTGHGAVPDLIRRDQMQRICIQHHGYLGRKDAIKQRAGRVAAAKARPNDKRPSSWIGERRIDGSVHDR